MSSPSDLILEPTAHETGSIRPRSCALICIALFTTTAAIFWPACDHQFLFWDDNCYVFREPRVLGGINWRGLIWAMTADVALHWHPLTLMSLQLDAELFGTGPLGFHRTAVVLHAMNAALAFLAMHALTGNVCRSAIVAVLFAIHPLRVESVAWIAERKDLVSGLFFWLTILCYTRYCEAPSKVRYSALAVCFTFGLSAKSMLVTTPCVLLLLDYWPLKRWRGDSLVANQMLLLEKIPLFVISALASLITLAYQRRVLADYGGLPLDDRIRNAATSFVSYISQSFWPTDLSPFYTIHKVPSFDYFRSLALLLGLTCVALWQFRQRPYLLVGWLWFVGMLVPVSGIAQCGRQARADRYTYLAQVGLLIAIVWLVAEIALKTRRGKLISLAILLTYLIGLSVITRQQIPVWHDTESIWREAYRLDHDSHVVVQENLIKSLLWQGKKPEAIQLTRQFIEDTDDSYKLVSFAMLLAVAGEHEACIETLDRILRRPHPKQAELLSNRGKANAALGRWQDAVHDFQTAASLSVQPSFQFYLAHALGKVGRDAESREVYTKAIRRSPRWPEEALRNAWQLSTSPNLEDRVDFWPICLTEQAMEAVAASQPGMTLPSQFLDCLGAAYAQSGRYADAIKAARQALELAEATGDVVTASGVRIRLKLYDSQEPFRENSAR